MLRISDRYPRLDIPADIPDEAIEDEPRAVSVIRAYRDRLRGGHEMISAEALRVRPDPGHPGCYEIYDGVLRLRALELAECERALVSVEDLSDAEVYLAMLRDDNRANLSRLELGMLIRALLRGGGSTQVEIAGELGKSKQYVGQLVAAARVGEAVSGQVDLTALADKTQHLHAISEEAPRERWPDLVRNVVEEGWSAKQSRAHARQAARDGEEPAPEPPVRAEPLTQRGEVLLLGRHRLMCGDILDADDRERLLDGVVPDAIYADPPYGVNSIRGDTSQWSGAASRYDPVIGDDDAETAKRAFRALAPLGAAVQVWWGSQYYLSVLPEATKWLIWSKRAGDDYNRLGDAELAWTNLGGSPREYRHVWNGFTRDSERGELRSHPNQKPVKLAEWCFSELRAGELVLDPFSGSGSALIACERSGRTCLAMEVSAAHCDAICARFQRETGIVPILEETGEKRDYLGSGVEAAREESVTVTAG